MLYEREIQKDLIRALDTKEITVITGMRRVGKTTLLKAIYDSITSTNKTFLDLENPIEQRIFAELDYNNIWENLKSYGIRKDQRAFLFLDEIQSLPSVVKPMKYLYDHYNVKFVVTGSSSFYLKNLFPESLAGRKTIFELFPLNFREYLLFKGIIKTKLAGLTEIDVAKNVIAYEKVRRLYDEFLEYGGFPQVVLADTVSQKKSTLSDIVTSYFEKDVRLLADFRNMAAFKDLFFLLLQRVGSRLDITRLSSEAGVSRETVYTYLAFLQATYVVFMIQPFTKNRDREVSGTRKVYCCDNGILNAFAKVSEGSVFENACYLSLRRFGNVRYYQKRSGAEIDFILPEDNTAIEAKMRATHHDKNRIEKISSSLGLNRSFVLTKEFNPRPGYIPALDV